MVSSNFKLILSFLTKFIVDLVFPKECFVCGLEKTYLCENCFKKIEINQKYFCYLCKKENEFLHGCKNCQDDYFLSEVFIATNYDNEILKTLIHNLKYKYITELSEDLAKILVKYIEIQKLFKKLDINLHNTVLVSVPLHTKRFLSRGFNQTELITQEISKFYNIPVSDLIKRENNTISQVGLSKNERKKNVKNAFVINKNANIDKNKKIIIIDDVITTGSTLNECARILKSKGFKNVYGLVVAQNDD